MGQAMVSEGDLDGYLVMGGRSVLEWVGSFEITTQKWSSADERVFLTQLRKRMSKERYVFKRGH